MLNIFKDFSELRQSLLLSLVHEREGGLIPFVLALYVTLKNINLNFFFADETWEVGEKILWRLLEAEESRLVAELRRRNQDWGLTRVKQVGRRLFYNGENFYLFSAYL